MTSDRLKTAVAHAVLAASLLLAAAGCTDVVNAGTVISAQTVDAADTAPPADGARTLEEICTSTGGHVEVRRCCGTIEDDFAPLCWNNSCCSGGTPGGVMKDVRLCICPQRSCFSPTPVGKFPAGCNYEEQSVPRPDAATDGAA